MIMDHNYLGPAQVWSSANYLQHTHTFKLGTKSGEPPSNAHCLVMLSFYITKLDLTVICYVRMLCSAIINKVNKLNLKYI